MTTKPPPPAVPINERCLALFAFFGLAAGVVLVCIAWAVSAVYEPPVWRVVLGTIGVALLGARVCDWAARRHVEGRAHNPGTP